MKYIRYFENLDNDIDSLIYSVVDRQVKNSTKYGLEIRPEDIENEKTTISYFIKKHYKEIKGVSWNDYEKLQRKLTMEILLDLRPQLEYYFYNTPEGETKTRYNIHLEYVISEIFRELSP